MSVPGDLRSLWFFSFVRYVIMLRFDDAADATQSDGLVASHPRETFLIFGLSGVS